MTTITLQAHAEKLAPPDAVPGYHGNSPLLYHQARTFAALRHAPLVMNTYPTGTGKTVAALLWLLHLQQQRANTLVVAPTNALIGQHTADIQAFVEHNGLEMDVVQANAARLQELAPDLRAGERLQRLIHNPRTFEERLGLDQHVGRRPFVLVTNPDIFYLALYFQYGRKDQRNMFQGLISQFQYVVIDEFHYYDNKQFASFLFFFSLWKRWGYFDIAENKICLLSATPRNQVYRYLDRVFGEQAWKLVAPENEPAESAELATTPTLAELHVQVVSGQIDEWVQEQQDAVAAWQAADLDSAIISSSLNRINRINHRLRSLDPVRITGPEPPEERQRVRPLVLATPTVDIGYNFGRPGKLRQSIDRLVCDARFGDELTQRIGRAGRVLGRQQTSIPSEAVVVLSDEAATELAQYDGQQFSRGAWAAVVQQLEHLPPKHQLDGYIATYALREAFYPLFHVQKLAAPDNRLEVEEELFQTIREVFAPHTKQQAWQLRRSYAVYEQRRGWLGGAERQRWALDDQQNRKHLAQIVAEYLSWLASSKEREEQYQADQVAPQLPQILCREPQKREVTTFVESQVALTKALFAFREAWQGPIVGVYDPHRLFSSELVNQYDVLHLVATYQFRSFQSFAEFAQVCGADGRIDEGLPMYLELRDFREPRLVIGFAYDSALERTEFEQRYCRQVVALRGFHLEAYEPGTKAFTLHESLTSLIRDDWLPCLIVEEEHQGLLISKLRGSHFYSRQLVVTFPGGNSARYLLVTGSAAFHLYAALAGAFRAMERLQGTDWIVL